MNKDNQKYDPFSLFEELKSEVYEKLKSTVFEQMQDTLLEQLQGNEKKVQAEKIDVQRGFQAKGQENSTPGGNSVPHSKPISLNGDLYYEIEYDFSPIPGAGKFVLKSQKIEPQVRDEVRDIFDQMRDIARQMRSYAINTSRFYDKRVQHENARIFYEQGMFMQEFEDHYAKKITCSAYYPRYQMMGYDQLRTYFTWRTEVRGGYVEKTSTSYAFMYIYELLNNIGVKNPQDGLEKLLFFWREFRVYDNTVDKYVLKWLKDYHIYYELPHSFREFAGENGLEEYYPEDAEEQGEFERYCSLSKYDIRNSRFYPEKEALIRKCFAFMMERVQTVLEEKGLCLEDFLFVPVSSMPAWEPFSGALFHPWVKQRDRRVEFSKREIYVCKENHWYAHQELTTESGKTLLGYCMKQMEAVLRDLTKYKYKITASPAMVRSAVTDKLSAAGIELEKVVMDAVKDYYREANKIVVKVDQDSLAAIRREAYETQEKLIVPEEEVSEVISGVWQECAVSSDVSKRYSAVKDDLPEEKIPEEKLPEEKTAEEKLLEEKLPEEKTAEEKLPEEKLPEEKTAEEKMPEEKLLKEKTAGQKMPEEKLPEEKTAGQKMPEEKLLKEKRMAESDMPVKHMTASLEDNFSGPWEELREALSQAELQALSILVRDAAKIRSFADEQGIMLEVLLDGINEKAMDFVGDSLFDEEFVIYDEYLDDVKEMVK